MFIIVREHDGIIVGSAINPINIDEASKNGRIVYEIDDVDFDRSLIGQKLIDYEIIKQ